MDNHIRIRYELGLKDIFIILLYFIISLKLKKSEYVVNSKVLRKVIHQKILPTAKL